MRKITITQGLIELKQYDKRITKAISKRFLGYKKKSDNVVFNTDENTFRNNIKSDYASVLSLIKNRAELKSAIVLSNANTIITVGELSMTVAEAIEYKNSISYEKSLLYELRQQFTDCERIITLNNNKLDSTIQDTLDTIYGRDKKTSADEIESVVKSIKERDTYVFVDEIDIRKHIDELEKIISDFEDNIDTVLSVSNATTFIEVE